MQKLLFAALACWCAACSAADLPVLGVYESVPVMGDGVHITARPAYILTNQKLSAPAVFSGLNEYGGSIDVLCCFQVSDIKPLSLQGELAKYASDAEFVAHFKAIKGYRYVYAAHPSPDRKQWSDIMRVLVEKAANPENATPYTVPVVAATFDKPTIPSTFTVGRAQLKLTTRYDKATGRVHYTFKSAGQTVVFSEPTFGD